MKRYWLIIGAMLCLLLAACSAPPEKETVPANENSEVSVSEKSEVSASEKSEVSVSEKSEVSVSEKSEVSVSEKSEVSMSENSESQEEETEMKLQVQIGDYMFTAALEQNQAVNEFVEMMRQGPVTIEMTDYSGFEKVGPLGKSLTTENRQTTTAAGDIVLYNGDQIVIFYGSNSWSYTRIGKIDDLTNWKQALGSGDVTAVFTLAE